LDNNIKLNFFKITFSIVGRLTTEGANTILFDACLVFST